MGKLSAFFEQSEFTCHCGCGSEVSVDPKFLNLLDAMRDRVGPIWISSGYRCPKHNETVGGVKDSAHAELPLRAADLRVADSEDRFNLVEAALAVGFRRVGVYKDENCVHVDLCDTKPQYVLWVR